MNGYQLVKRATKRYLFDPLLFNSLDQAIRHFNFKSEVSRIDQRQNTMDHGS